jgi:hypothetical protein
MHLIVAPSLLKMEKGVHGHAHQESPKKDQEGTRAAHAAVFAFAHRAFH